MNLQSCHEQWECCDDFFFWLIDWLIVCCMYPFRKYFTFTRKSLLPIRAAKCRPSLGAKSFDLWPWSSLYSNTCYVYMISAEGLPPFKSPFLRQAMGFWGPILTRISYWNIQIYREPMTLSVTTFFHGSHLRRFVRWQAQIQNSKNHKIFKNFLSFIFFFFSVKCWLKIIYC